jgi:hypothetical protein
LLADPQSNETIDVFYINKNNYIYNSTGMSARGPISESGGSGVRCEVTTLFYRGLHLSNENPQLAGGG